MEEKFTLLKTKGKRNTKRVASKWLQMKRILRYLQGTKTYGLLYTGAENSIDAYPDASLGTGKNSSSISGFVIKVFGDV